MLFNSHEFIFFFLPLTLAGYLLLGRFSKFRAALTWLAVASLFFYGWWNPKYLILILGSILTNYSIASLMLNPRFQAKKKPILIAGIVFNLGLIGYFKYYNFFLGTAYHLIGSDYQTENIILPLAISFFTFQQIAYLVDVYSEKVSSQNILTYFTFVIFFPQLIAGPIVHHKDVIPQFKQSSAFGFQANNFAIGISIFICGLFKKVVLADNAELYASPLFDGVNNGMEPSFWFAWGGALAYTFQLYFDFSGYSDMAIGLARMFNIKLPVNFNSPYKSRSIVEFWRRWHITLSTFLRDYLYIPLGGNRKGVYRQDLNLLITMLLGGLWHGANWTFVVWGGLHGLYLLINHNWRRLAGKIGLSGLLENRFYSLLAMLLTFLSVVVAWVFFRAESLDAALVIASSMFNISQAFNIPFGNLHLTHTLYLVILAAIAFAAPNSQELFCGARTSSDCPKKRAAPESVGTFAIRWKPTITWSLVVSGLFISCLMLLNRESEFLYFQF